MRVTESHHDRKPTDPKVVKLVTDRVYGGGPPNEVRVAPCATWGEFYENVRLTNKPMLGRVFRGQSESTWRLQSQWDRYAEQAKGMSDIDRSLAGRTDTAESLLERFKALYIGTSGRDTSSMTNDQWMALGRHHGLITRLLDWTRSPFVAAFFAFRGFLPIDPRLGCLNPLSRVDASGTVAIWELPQESACNNFEHFKFVAGRDEFAYRQRAQSGVFTLVDPPEHNSLDAYLSSEGYAHCLTRYEIPRTEAVKAMQDMSLMNISDGTLFPDGDGAARQANLGDNLDWAFMLEDMRRVAKIMPPPQRASSD